MQVPESSSPDAVTITAAQVVFTNVEVEQSPLGHRGFQTVFYTEDRISKEVLQSEIEPALQYFPRSGYGPTDSPPEFVFFALSSKQIAVGRITPLLDKLDKFGRKKMLFAHVLIFDANDFLDILNNNPFVVLDADPFFRSYEEVLARESVTPCRFHIPQRGLTFTSSDPAFDPSKIPPHLLEGDHLLKLLFFASASATPRRATFTLEVHGQSGPILELMRSLFALIPPEFRSACSFDTSFVGDTGQSKSSRSTLWANGVGKGQRLQQDAVIRIDLEKNTSELQRVTVEVVTPFERWLKERPPTSASALVSAPMQGRIRSAAFLQDLLWGRRYSAATAGIDQHGVFEEFLECNQSYIAELLTRNFQRQFGEALADRLAQCAMKWIKTTGSSALAAVPRRFSTERLCEWLLPGFEKRPDAQPKTAEIKALQRCFSPDKQGQTLSKAERLLRAFYFYWTANWKQLQRLLSILNPEDFQRIAVWLVDAANLRAVARAYKSTKVALFFGFVGKGFRKNEQALALLQVLTFKPLSPGEIVPSPLAGKGYCRRIVLRKLIAPDTASKKKHEVTATASTPSTAIMTPPIPQIDHVIGQDPIPPWAIFQISPASVAFITGQSHFPPPRKPQELLHLLPSLCLAGEHHCAFFRMNDVWVIAELRRNGSNWTAFTVILDSAQFRAFRFNPFECITRAFGAFVGAPNSWDSSFNLRSDIAATTGMLLFASRNSRFRIRGSAHLLMDVVRQLFQILPDRLRMRCTYFTGEIPSDSPFREAFFIEATALNSSGTLPIFEIPGRCSSGLDKFEPATPFETCLYLAPRQTAWATSWPVDVRMFHQFFELNELLNDPANVPRTECFSVSAIQIFVSLNKTAVRESLQRLLRQQVGEALTSALLNRACYWIADRPSVLPLILRDGFKKQWLVSETTSWLVDEQVAPISNDQLHEIKNLHVSCGSDKSMTTWMLRALYAALAGKADQLAGLVAILENEHGDDADDSLLLVWHRGLMDLKPLDWKFEIREPTTPKEAEIEIGVEIQFHSLDTSEEENLASRVVPAFFGCEFDGVLFEGGPHLKQRPEVSGRFWPLLIDAFHVPCPAKPGGTSDAE